MKKIISSVIVAAIVILISGCGAESDQYLKDLEMLKSKHLSEIMEVDAALDPVIQSISLGMQPSISDIQSELSDVVDIIKEIQALVPPSSVKGDHDKMVQKMVEQASQYNDMALYLGTRQIANATQTMRNISQLHLDINDLIDDIKAELE